MLVYYRAAFEFVNCSLLKTDDDVEWTDIKRHAIEVISKFFEGGEAITTGAAHAESSKPNTAQID